MVRYTVDRARGVVKAVGRPGQGFDEGHGWFVGELRFSPDRAARTCEMTDLSVADEFQRRGIGRRLVRIAEAECRTVGALLAWAIPGDEEATEFWEHVGYRTGETPGGDHGVVRRLPRTSKRPRHSTA